MKAKALAEAAAAKAQAEYDKRLAEKEHERKRHEVEEQQRRAQYDKEIAFLTAEKRVAIANAKLEAIEKSIAQEEERSQDPGSDHKSIDYKHRLQEWISDQRNYDALPPESRNVPRDEQSVNVYLLYRPERNASQNTSNF